MAPAGPYPRSVFRNNRRPAPCHDPLVGLLRAAFTPDMLAFQICRCLQAGQILEVVQFVGSSRRANHYEQRRDCKDTHCRTPSSCKPSLHAADRSGVRHSDYTLMQKSVTATSAPAVTAVPRLRAGDSPVMARLSPLALSGCKVRFGEASGPAERPGWSAEPNVRSGPALRGARALPHSSLATAPPSRRARDRSPASSLHFSTWIARLTTRRFGAPQNASRCGQAMPRCSRHTR